MSAKIRLAQKRKVPYMLIVGEKEAAKGLVSVRFRDGRAQAVQTADGFIAYATNKISARFAGI
jgi:threonyl-tRNA synthetase